MSGILKKEMDWISEYMEDAIEVSLTEQNSDTYSCEHLTTTFTISTENMTVDGTDENGTAIVINETW